MLVRDSAAKGTTATVTIRCLGGFEILGRDGWLSGRDVSRGKQLIGYLIVHSRTVATRQALIEAFWPDADAESSVHRLHLVASGARAILRKSVGGAEALTCYGGGYAWNPAVRIESDAGRLLALEKSRDPEYCREAICLYQGEFLAGVSGDWLDPMRMRCAAAYSATLERLAETAYSIGDYHEALEQGLQLLAFDRAYEASARLVMRCFAALGRPFQAHEVFVALEQFLDKRLAVAPTHETRSLLNEILTFDRCKHPTLKPSGTDVVPAGAACNGRGSPHKTGTAIRLAN